MQYPNMPIRTPNIATKPAISEIPISIINSSSALGDLSDLGFKSLLPVNVQSYLNLVIPGD